MNNEEHHARFIAIWRAAILLPSESRGSGRGWCRLRLVDITHDISIRLIKSNIIIARRVVTGSSALYSRAILPSAASDVLLMSDKALCFIIFIKS